MVKGTMKCIKVMEYGTSRKKVIRRKVATIKVLATPSFEIHLISGRRFNFGKKGLKTGIVVHKTDFQKIKNSPYCKRRK